MACGAGLHDQYLKVHYYVEVLTSRRDSCRLHPKARAAFRPVRACSVRERTVTGGAEKRRTA